MLVEATITGKKALIMSTQRGADPTDPLVRDLSRLTKKTTSKMSEQDLDEIKRLKFLLNLHWRDELGVVIPGINLIKAVEEAARADKKGKDVLRYVGTVEEFIPLVHDGPTDRDELAAERKYVDTRLANHGSKGQVRMVLETRPIFPKWGLIAKFQIDETSIDYADFERWLTRSGEYYGLGAYRQVFGRFEAECKPVQR
jgi:hypothetical protein